MTETFDPSVLQVQAVVKPAEVSVLPSQHDVQRFETMMDSAQTPAQLNTGGADFYVDGPASASSHPLGLDSAMKNIGALSQELKAQMSAPAIDLPDDAPSHLKLLNAIGVGMRQSTLTTIKFEFVAKAIENAERGVQTLYKLQG